MAIHPIDLQTLYTQMDKVGRQQGAEHQAAASVKEVQQQQNKLDAQKKLNTVQIVAQSDDENVRINRDGHSKQDEKEQKKQKKKDAEEEAEKAENYIKELYLGQRVDISG